MEIQPSTLIPQRLLLLMRHAKTESPYTIKRDFDRRLTEQGERVALEMGTWLRSQGLQIDRILSSPANRTRQTTEGVCSGLGTNLEMAEFKEELFHATPDIFFQTIQSVSDEVSTLLIVSHNDGITQFANQLTNARIDHMQPGSVFGVSLIGNEWKEFSGTEKTFLFYKEPG